MTPEDRAVLATYVRARADDLGLRDWVFILEYEVADEDSAAHVTTAYGRREATISFRDDFRGQDPEFQRMAVVHELLHVPYHTVFWHIIKTLPALLGSATYEVWEQGFRQLDELANDTLASALAPKFPLIKWPRALRVVK